MTKAAASEESQTTAAAISSGFPIRPTGSCAITRSRPSGVPPNPVALMRGHGNVVVGRSYVPKADIHRRYFRELLSTESCYQAISLTLSAR